MSKARKYTNKIANGVTKAVGGGHLAEYAGAKIAKARAPKAQKKYIKSKATKKQAIKSAGAVALTVTGSGGVARAVGKRAVKKAIRKKAVKKTPKLKIIKGYKSKKGRTINKGDKWSRWGE